MTDAQPLSPTDAEIFVVAREAGLLPDNSHPAPETRAARKHSHAVQAFARAVLAKWGTPPQISASDTDYWLRHRALILQAIEDRGFRLVSSGGLFWLQHHGIKGGQHGTE